MQEDSTTLTWSTQEHSPGAFTQSHQEHPGVLTHPHPEHTRALTYPHLEHARLLTYPHIEPLGLVHTVGGCEHIELAKDGAPAETVIVLIDKQGLWGQRSQVWNKCNFLPSPYPHHTCGDTYGQVSFQKVPWHCLGHPWWDLGMRCPKSISSPPQGQIPFLHLVLPGTSGVQTLT